MSKKKLIIMIIAILLVAAIPLAIWLKQTIVTKDDVIAYNTKATTRAYAGGWIGKQDVLILESIDRDLGGDSKAKFQIYRLPDGANAADYLDKKASQIGNKLELVGTASCTFIGDDPSAIDDLYVIFLK